MDTVWIVNECQIDPKWIQIKLDRQIQRKWKSFSFLGLMDRSIFCIKTDVVYSEGLFSIRNTMV